MLLSLALGTALAGMLALAGTAREAEATFPGTNAGIVFSSNRTTGTGVDNPTGDSEIFTIKADGTGLKQLTNNTGRDEYPVVSPDGAKVTYQSQGDPATNAASDFEVYLMNASDGSNNKNLTNNAVGDYNPDFSPDGQRIAYESHGDSTTNPEGDTEIYVMSALDGSGKKNLSNTGNGVSDYGPVFSPDGTKVAYESRGIQNSNLEGDYEVYSVNATDGSGQSNLTNNGTDVGDYQPVFSPDGTKVVYSSEGTQNSNPQGDHEVYRMNATDGTGKKNLSNNGSGVGDLSPAFSHGGAKIAYTSYGVQTSNPQGDNEVYRMNVTDGLGKKNLSNNGSVVRDFGPFFSPDGKKIAYTSYGIQTSNPQGDNEIYTMNALDGLGKKNVTNDGAGDYFPDWGRQAM